METNSNRTQNIKRLIETDKTDEAQNVDSEQERHTEAEPETAVCWTKDDTEKEMSTKQPYTLIMIEKYRHNWPKASLKVSTFLKTSSINLEPSCRGICVEPWKII